MKIIVVSYYSESEITPRAFRATSITSGLRRLGHEVIVISPPKKNIRNNNAISKSGFSVSKNWVMSLKFTIRLIVQYFLPGWKDLKAGPFFFRKLNGMHADVVISIGLPFSVHLAVAVSRQFLGLRAATFIADYGDPYSSNPAANSCFYAAALERWALKAFDYVLIPVEIMKVAFVNLVNDEKSICVIPQGYKLDDVNKKVYKKNKQLAFAYAGVFYSKVRDPSKFFDYLCLLEIDFCFHIYTDLGNTETASILKKYKPLLQEKLLIHQLVPRDECIFNLSGMDFLINFNNAGGVQVPSKIIDYTLSDRPYLSISPELSIFSEFDSFCGGNYSSFSKPDISGFDQNVIAKKIVSLHSLSQSEILL